MQTVCGVIAAAYKHNAGRTIPNWRLIGYWGTVSGYNSCVRARVVVTVFVQKIIGARVS